MALLKRIISSNKAQRHQYREAELYLALVRREAKIGGELFGPTPKGTRREFFCLDEHTWIWHEEWLDANGKRQIRTTRYDIHPKGILKAQDGQNYQPVSDGEALNLRNAVINYNKRIRGELYAEFI